MWDFIQKWLEQDGFRIISGLLPNHPKLAIGLAVGLLAYLIYLMAKKAEKQWQDDSKGVDEVHEQLPKDQDTGRQVQDELDDFFGDEKKP